MAFAQSGWQMNERQHTIWQKIDQHAFDDPGSSYPFSVRLSKENGWSRARTERCLQEYKRFLLLAATAGHPVSPPDAVDQVWHLHLLYTRNYWEQLCKKVLGMDLHHHPTQGGAIESSKFDDWYQKTLSSYKLTFNQTAPPDIWPTSQTKKPHDFKRIDAQSCWIIPKLHAIQSAVIAVILIAIIAFASGCDSVARGATSIPLGSVDNPFDYKGTEFLGFYLSILVMAIIATIAFRWQAKNSAQPFQENHRLTPIQTGYLRGKETGAVRTAITSLIHLKKLSFDYQTKRFQTELNPDKNDAPLEQTILHYCKSPKPLFKIEQAARYDLNEIDTHLSEMGYLVPKTNRNISGIGVLMIAAVLIVGVIKVIVGMQRQRPVGFLVLACFATVVILILFKAKGIFRSRAGDRIFDDMKATYRKPPVENRSSTNNTASDLGTGFYHDPFHLPMMYALYGNTALAHDPQMSAIHHSIDSSNNSSNSISSGDSSSCSGGGDSGSDAGGGDSGGGDSGGSGCGGCGGGGGD